MINLGSRRYHQPLLATIQDFLSLEPEKRGKWFEWIVAQELWRRDAIRGTDHPEFMRFWQSQDHEVDFYNPPNNFFEVKSGRIDLRDFDWFSRVFQKQTLTVIGDESRSFGSINCVRLIDFLSNGY